MTSYETIYERFLGKIKSFELAQLDDTEIEEYCYELMTSAIIKIPDLQNDLYEQLDDSTDSFAIELSGLEIEAIACGMVVEWIDKYLNTEQLLNMFVGTKEESMASQANHMKYLTELREKQMSTVNRIMRDRSYRDFIKEV